MMEDDAPAGPVPTDTSTPDVQWIVEALLKLDQQMRTSLDDEVDRAEAAEQRLAEAERELADMRRRAEDAERATHLMYETLSTAIRDYLEETGRAELALIALTRRLIGAKPPEGPTAGVRPAAPERPIPSAEWEYFAPDHDDSDDPVTDEHRLIDLENLIDMRRLDASHRVGNPVQSLLRRRV